MQILTRTQAVMEVAIPKQIEFMISQGYIPSWGLFKQSTGWEETIENLQLTKADQLEYENKWNETLFKMKEGAH